MYEILINICLRAGTQARVCVYAYKRIYTHKRTYVYMSMSIYIDIAYTYIGVGVLESLTEYGRIRRRTH